MSIKQQLSSGLFVILLIVGISVGYTMYTFSVSELDTVEINLLGKNRMLAQKMAKSALSIAMSKNILKQIEESVRSDDQYITQMRKVYTQQVVNVAKEKGIELSMTPHVGESLPYPATYTRLVNNNFSAAMQGQSEIDILAKNPVNDDKILTQESDKRAWKALEENPDKLYFELEKQEDGGVNILYYSADIATVQACVDCHNTMKNTRFKVGDMLGIRKYRIFYSKDEKLAKSVLKPSDKELIEAKQAFQKTLDIIQKGGNVSAIQHNKKQQVYLKPLTDTAMKNQLTKIQTEFEQYLKTIDALFLVKANSDTMQQLIIKLLAQSNSLMISSDQLVKMYTALAGKHQSNLYIELSIATVLIILVLIVFIWTLSCTVAKPMMTLANCLHAVADRDMRVVMPNEGYNKEVLDIAESFNIMIHNLRSELDNVMAVTQQLSSTAVQMSEATERTAQGANIQQEKTDSMGNAVNQMMVAVQNVLDSANSASEFTHAANDKSREGQNTLQQTIQSISSLAQEVDQATSVISELTQETETIGSVLDVIRGISEQTNLLALNAAIEAARAGEQGRGFAVVADEVRTLAARTQESTQEIQSMIERLQNGARSAAQVMESGKQKALETEQQAGHADNALKTIADVVSQANEMNQKITHAAQEQTTVAQDIDRSVNDIRGIADKTSDDALQTKTASHALQDLANQLNTITQSFKVG